MTDSGTWVAKVRYLSVTMPKEKAIGTPAATSTITSPSRQTTRF